jgi:hypothetical protein
MLSRERKIAILKSFPDMSERMMSNDRITIEYTALVTLLPIYSTRPATAM